MGTTLAERAGPEAAERKGDHAAGAMPGKSTLTQQLGAPAHAEEARGGLSDGGGDKHGRVLGGGDPTHAAPAGDGAAPAAPAGGPAAPAASTAAHSISTNDTSAAQWLDHGQFRWWVGFRTDGRSGWIVQHISNTYAGTKQDGTAITNATVGSVPSYYESWAVNAAGAVSPGRGGTNDMWERPGQGAGSRGSWSMRGQVYWTAQDPALSGHSSGGVSNAGILVSGTSAPAGIGGALMNRSANGTWDSTGTNHTHTGSAA